MMNFRNNTIILISWLIMAAALWYMHMMPELTSVPLKKALSNFPLELDGWQGIDESLLPITADFFMFDDALIRTYETAASDEVFTIYLAYFEFMEKRKRPHVPRVCWTGSGWSIRSLGITMIDIGNGDHRSIPVGKLLAEKDGHRIIQLYCYRLNGRYIADFLTFRIMSVFDSVFIRKNSAFSLQLYSELKPDEPLESQESVERFLSEVLLILEKDFFTEK